MTDKTLTYHATADDMAFAAEYNAQQKAAPASPELSAEHLIAEANNPSDTLTLPNGASLRIIRNEPAQTLRVGEADPHAYVTETKIEALQRQADFLIERLDGVTDPATGGPRAGYEAEHQRYVMQLHQVQRTAAYEQTVGESLRRARDNDPTQGVAQLRAEAEFQDRRSADRNARALDEMFGRVRIV